jgi:RNA polymerase sigma-70 factor (ECF subfamily)
MSAAHRDLLVELYFRDRPVDDVARWLRIRDDAVRTKTYYALRSLHLALEERGVAGP